MFTVSGVFALYPLSEEKLERCLQAGDTKEAERFTFCGPHIVAKLFFFISIVVLSEKK